MTEQETIFAPIVADKAAPDKEDAVSIANMDETDWKTMLAEMRIA
jgi:hypothetical protein